MSNLHWSISTTIDGEVVTITLTRQQAKELAQAAKALREREKALANAVDELASRGMYHRLDVRKQYHTLTQHVDTLLKLTDTFVDLV